jgi:dTMP kinase
MFIVFEGGDGSGKSTQASLLKAYLDSKGVPCTLLRCPNRTLPSGSVIASYLKGDSQFACPQVANLLLAANVWEVATVAEQALGMGHVVIMDRFKHTHFAYSMARGSTWEQVTAVMEGIRSPDKVVFMDLPIEEALSRKTGPLEVLETPKVQTMVRQNYKQMIQPDWIIMDGKETQEDIHNKLVNLLNI